MLGTYRTEEVLERQDPTKKVVISDRRHPCSAAEYRTRWLRGSVPSWCPGRQLPPRRPLPSLAPAFTRTTSVKVATEAAVKVGLVLVTGPVPPTTGVVDVQPAGAVKETKVVPGGTLSVKVRPVRTWLGPLLVTV